MAEEIETSLAEKIISLTYNMERKHHCQLALSMELTLFKIISCLTALGNLDGEIYQRSNIFLSPNFFMFNCDSVSLNNQKIKFIDIYLQKSAEYCKLYMSVLQLFVAKRLSQIFCGLFIGKSSFSFSESMTHTP